MAYTGCKCLNKGGKIVAYTQDLDRIRTNFCTIGIFRLTLKANRKASERSMKHLLGVLTKLPTFNDVRKGAGIFSSKGVIREADLFESEAK